MKSVRILALVCLAMSGSTTLGLSQGVEHYIEKEYSFVYLSDYNMAIDSLNMLMASGADTREFYYYRSWCHFLHGKIPEAFNDAETYAKLKRTKHAYEGLILLGKLYSVRAASGKAYRVYDEAIELYPYRQEAYVEKGWLYVAGMNVEEGITEIGKAQKRFPENNELLLSHGILLVRGGQYKAGYKDLTKLLTSVDTVAIELQQLANLWASRASLLVKDYRTAWIHANRCVELSPQNPESYGVRGEANYYLNNLDEALKDFLTMESGLEYSQNWEFIGRIYDAQQNTEKACHYYAKHCNQGYQSEYSCQRVSALGCK